jgi:hypothetical protein
MERVGLVDYPITSHRKPIRFPAAVEGFQHPAQFDNAGAICPRYQRVQCAQDTGSTFGLSMAGSRRREGAVVTVDDLEGQQGYPRVPTHWQRFRLWAKRIFGPWKTPPRKDAPRWQRLRFWALWIAVVVFSLLVVAYGIALIVTSQGAPGPPP